MIVRLVMATLATGAAFAISPQASADLTGGELYRECAAAGESDEATADLLHCINYLKGYQDGLREVRKLSPIACSPPPCSPSHILLCSHAGPSGIPNGCRGQHQTLSRQL